MCADSTRMQCAGRWPAYYGDLTMTSHTEGPPRPPDTPALRRAEAALSEVEAAAEATPAEQAPLLAAAQSELSALLAEEPASPVVDLPDDL